MTAKVEPIIQITRRRCLGKQAHSASKVHAADIPAAQAGP